MKTTRMTAFVFACIGMGWLLLTYAGALFILQMMMDAIANGGDVNIVVAFFIAIFAAASILIIFIGPIVPAIISLLFSLTALKSSLKWVRVTAIVFTSLCGLSLLASVIGLLVLILR